MGKKIKKVPEEAMDRALPVALAGEHSGNGELYRKGRDPLPGTCIECSGQRVERPRKAWVRRRRNTGIRRTRSHRADPAGDRVGDFRSAWSCRKARPETNYSARQDAKAWDLASRRTGSGKGLTNPPTAPYDGLVMPCLLPPSNSLFDFPTIKEHASTSCPKPVNMPRFGR